MGNETIEMEKTENGFKMQPKAAVGKTATMKALLERMLPEIQKVIPRHVTPERMLKTVMVAVNRTPQLLRCTQESVMESLMRAGELGLDVSGTLGEAYLVPFGNQCTLIPGYRGLAKLARQSGDVKRIEANAVYENDDFDFVEGTEARLTLRRNLGDDRGELVGFYALAEFKDGGIQADFMTAADVEKVRQKAQSKNSPAWKEHFDEMGRKTVFRRLAKWLPLSGEKWDKIVELDNADYPDIGAAVEAIPAGASKAEALADRLLGKAEDDVEPAAEPEDAEDADGPPWATISSKQAEELRSRGLALKLDTADLLKMFSASEDISKLEHLDAEDFEEYVEALDEFEAKARG